jgi:hypothetical protein
MPVHGIGWPGRTSARNGAEAGLVPILPPRRNERQRAGLRALLCLLLLPGLQGCLFTRVLETRAQLCDERPPRVIVAQEAGRGLRVVFRTPTLTEQDVIRIVGFEPSETGGSSAVRELRYEARPVHRPLDRATGFVAKLSFTRDRGEYRLAEIEIPEKFNAILPPPLLDAAVKVTCKAQVVVVPPSTSFDLSAVDRATLPTRHALAQLLGPPTAASPRNDDISYQYCLVPCDAKSSMVASLAFSFGAGGELQRAQASYFRYLARVDLSSSRPTATIELF